MLSERALVFLSHTAPADRTGGGKHTEEHTMANVLNLQKMITVEGGKTEPEESWSISSCDSHSC
ncbi:hypothetical protein AMK19_08040 [Kitasatospora sp. CB01950]|nr:hypothetical protein AMK19_08040 [Kitasatospora sp. CB01950]